LNRAVALLFSAFIAVPLTATSLAAQAPQKPLTVDAIFAHGPLIGTPPEGLTWSPDAKHLTYLEDGELIDLAPGTGKSHVLVSHAKLAAITGAGGSETDRDHRDRYKMASYLWAPDSAHLLFDSSGRLWLYDLQNGTGVEVGFTGTAAGDDPKFSPNSEYLSFVRDHSLCVLRLKAAGTPTTIVAPAPNTVTSNGEVDWLYLEELEVRSNYFWSPDSKKLAFLQMNQTEVPLYPLTDWIPTHASVEMQRYPQPGDPNPNVRVGVVNTQGSKPVWINLPIKPGQDYIPRFGWVDPKTLWIETITRDQKHRDIYFADAATGQAHPVLQFTDENFFDDKYDVAVGNGSLLLTNWTDGHNHLYLYRYDATNPQASAVKLERQLTKGEFDVGEVLRVDPGGKQVIFASNEGNPLEQQIWQAGFDGQRKQLTTGAGSHIGNFSPTGNAFVNKYSTRMDPPALSLCRTGGKCTVFWQTRALEPYQLRAPEQLTVKGHDGTAAVARGNPKRGDRAPDCESLWRPRRADGGQPLERQPAVRRTAGAAWFCRAARRQSRLAQPRERLCPGGISQLWPGAI
jgi:dipeptidyl-peptidase-4